MLPVWMQGGTPIVRADLLAAFHAVAEIQPIPLTRRRVPPLPLIPLVLLIGGALYFLLTSRSPTRTSIGYPPLAPPHSTHHALSPFAVDPSLFIPPPPFPAPPSYLPAPVSPKAQGMVVPNAVHYVYGLKPVKAGQKGEELPYYAYLAMRSALLNIRPEKMYL